MHYLNCNIVSDYLLKHCSYAGDCDISFTLSGLSGGIKDFQVNIYLGNNHCHIHVIIYIF